MSHSHKLASFRLIVCAKKLSPSLTVVLFYSYICILRKLNELGVKEKYQVEIIKRFETLENLNVDEKVNSSCENIKQNIKTSAKGSLGLHEWKKHNTWFDKECVDFLDQRKQTKMQWIQDPSRSNVDNMKNVRRNVSRYFRNKRRHF